MQMNGKMRKYQHSFSVLRKTAPETARGRGWWSSFSFQEHREVSYVRNSLPPVISWQNHADSKLKPKLKPTSLLSAVAHRRGPPLWLQLISPVLVHPASHGYRIRASLAVCSSSPIQPQRCVETGPLDNPEAPQPLTSLPPSRGQYKFSVFPCCVSKRFACSLFRWFRALLSPSPGLGEGPTSPAHGLFLGH